MGDCMRASKLKLKEVVRMSDGKKIGKVTDFEFDVHNYELQAFCIQEKTGFFFPLFKNERVLILPVSSIVQIGKDVIFADVSHEKR